ncbi:MAG: ATPase [Gammaproteobacteria bacterium]|nr:ATPase [Gammaproteobacteria bacterium]
MPDMGGEVLATRVAFLELRDERRLVQEGYELLDEKRVLLATEILRQLRHYGALQEQLRQHEQAARTAHEAAVDAYGFDDLTGEAKWSLEDTLVRTSTQTFLGLHLVEATLEQPAAPEQPRSLLPLPEARACAKAFRRLLEDHVSIAACAGNLRRLAREYTRTERRARALENVVLPEIDQSLRFIEEQLDAVDQEEAIRVRNAAGARG